jgi:transposase-like protein
MNSNRSGRRYDREFKNNAVALVRGGRTITEVAPIFGPRLSRAAAIASRARPAAKAARHYILFFSLHESSLRSSRSSGP